MRLNYSLIAGAIALAIIAGAIALAIIAGAAPAQAFSIFGIEIKPHVLTAEECAAKHSADYCEAAFSRDSIMTPGGQCKPWEHPSGSGEGCVCNKP